VKSREAEPTNARRNFIIWPRQNVGSTLRGDGFKSGWGYFVNRQQMLKGWLNRREKSDSKYCQPWPRIPRLCHRYGNWLSTTEVTTKKNTVDYSLAVFFLSRLALHGDAEDNQFGSRGSDNLSFPSDTPARPGIKRIPAHPPRRESP
jgi:hypothetical protein